jgi:hypothetical protein
MLEISGFKRDRQGVWIEKSPDATLDYTLNWAGVLPPDQLIITSTWEIESIPDDAAPLAQVTKSFISPYTTIVLTGGTIGKMYTVKNIITTETYTEAREFRVLIKARSI